MAKQIKQILLRDDYTHVYYDITFSSSRAGAFYVMPYASPMGAYVATYQDPERTKRSSTSNTTHYEAPKLSNYDEILATLDAELSTLENNEHIATLLNSDFVFGKSGPAYEKTKYHDQDTETQTNTYTYQNYETRPVIEALLLHRSEACRELLAKANVNEEKRKQILTAMQKIQLEQNEAINFTEFNLSNASFIDAQLAQSTFDGANTTGANFDGCDLANTTISQEQLDAAASYKDATLANGMWIYWDQTIKSELLTRIEKMEKHIAEEIPDVHDPKHIKVKALCDQYKPLLNEQGTISSATKNEIMTAFTGEATMKILSQYRNLKSRAAEIGVFLAGLFTGVGLIAYGIALSIQRYRNGYWGLFAKPKTAVLANQVFQHTPTRVGVK